MKFKKEKYKIRIIFPINLNVKNLKWILKKKRSNTKSWLWISLCKCNISTRFILIQTEIFSSLEIRNHDEKRKRTTLWMFRRTVPKSAPRIFLEYHSCRLDIHKAEKYLVSNQKISMKLREISFTIRTYVVETSAFFLDLQPGIISFALLSSPFLPPFLPYFFITFCFIHSLITLHLLPSSSLDPIISSFFA